ncbi:MAG: thioredoxin family protein [Actinomycetia bacterium]|nr:thioredoxin family protein [Actinomycetes bacterium]
MSNGAHVQILSTPGCAGCDQIKELVDEVLSTFPELSWEEIDLVEHPEVAGRHSIMSVPAVVIDGRLEFARIPTRKALEESVRAFSERKQT